MSIAAVGLVKTFGTSPTPVLRDLSLEIRAGEFVSLMGRSGSGKSTLLYLLSGLDTPSAGSVEYEGEDLGKMESSRLHRLRNTQIGFVFQFHYLLPELSALENVLMPAVKCREVGPRTARARKLLEWLGLGEKTHRLPRELSGGEQQRVAIARALCLEPKFLFADEPTGNLDSASGDAVMRILRQVNAESGTTIVMVTHDSGYASQASRCLQMADGRIISDSRPEIPEERL